MVESSGNAKNGEPPLQVITRGDAIRMAVLEARRDGKRVGLVPTMGALHEGHLSLIDASVADCHMTIATIFVNPIQFDQPDDLDRYPNDLDADVALLSDRGCDLVFAPPNGEIYGPTHETFVEVGQIAISFEGALRPGHFRGVATVVLKLFNLIPAHCAYFGQKDYQQTLVIRRMAADFGLPMEISVCPTVREPNGLAMSSRNTRLSDEQREQALALSQSMALAEQMVASGEHDAATLVRQMRAHIESAGGVEVEYLALVAEGTMTPVDRVEGPTVALIAAHVGKTRLIDNRLIG